MNKFSWYEANSVRDALNNVNATASSILARGSESQKAIIKAGGIDLLDLMKEGLVSPGKVVSILKIPGLDQITRDPSGMRIGANVTLSDLEKNDQLKSEYLAIHQAVAHAGTPQTRNTATLGGNLAQRTRCWYFRSIDHECYRKGSGTCYAQKGENEYHAIINNDPCASVHASSVSTALMAFDARVEIEAADGHKKVVSLDEFFVHPADDSRVETILQAGELITAVILPPVKGDVRSWYIKHGSRESHDWAMADVAVVATYKGRTCKKAEIVLGAAAPVPLRVQKAAGRLQNQVVDEALAASVGDLSMEGATPLEKNAYKVSVFKAIVKRAILKTKGS
jgi:xanthine dehydrogenase YagS FAD-binding subunit